jgi:hypothetical protein
MVGSSQMDQAWVPLQGGCTPWAAVGWEVGVGGGEDDDGGGGGGAFHTSGTPAAVEMTCAVGDGAVPAAAVVAAVGTHPRTCFPAGGCNRQCKDALI